MNSKSIILVTGADGFIGSHLVEKLVDKGYNVKAFCYYNSYNSWRWLDTFKSKYYLIFEKSLNKVVNILSLAFDINLL